MDDRVYLCIDLKTFYASVECRDRGLDPFTTNLVVADPDRTDTTICLAITPAMKALGIRNRCRVFEIPEDVDFIMAKPHMRRYMEVSADIYSVYLRYISPDDMHVYSIDECFMDATPYLELYSTTPKGLAKMLMKAVFDETGICATAGIGTNLFLAKVALDVTAKHAEDNIGCLDEGTFKELIWPHRPITDIWNVGPGIAKRLAKHSVFDLEGVAAMDPNVLYREFGVNAEFLIDHAHGIEPCTMKQIKAYEPKGSSMVNGQVLPCSYTFDEALVVVREMVDASVLELVEKQLVTDHVSLGVGYAHDRKGEGESVSKGSVFVGEHGARPIGGGRGGTHAGGGRKIPEKTNSFKKLMAYVEALYRETVDPTRPIKRLNVGFGGLVSEDFATFDLFSDVEASSKERRMQEAVLAVKGKFGKNALLKGMSLAEKATARERNEQVGGHNG